MIDDVCQTAAGDMFVDCWVELRGDTLTFSRKKSARNRRVRALKPRPITFCAKVDPPSATVCSTAEMKLLAGKIMSKQYLAVYTADDQGIWFELSSAPSEIERWLQALKNAVEMRDGSQAWIARQSAYERLMPLVWRQLLTQGKDFMQMMDFGHRLGLLDAELIRRDEQVNGWLQFRTEDDGSDSDSFDAKDGVWTDVFCALSSNLFLVYEGTQHPLAEEIVCLQLATVSASLQWSCAFNIITPIRTLEIRAPDDATLEKWTDAIFALQSTDAFSALVPQGLQKEHLVNRLTGKGGGMILRLFKRAASTSKRPTLKGEFFSGAFDQPGTAPTFASTFTAEHETIELSTMLKDPKLGAMLREYAEQRGMTADVKLFVDANDIFGSTDVEELESKEVERLPKDQKRRLFRLSTESLRYSKAPVEVKNDRKSRSEVAAESSVMQQAYELAARRLMGELVPAFCETEGFKSWLTQQQDDELAELHLIAMIQSSVGLAALGEQVQGTKEEHVLSAAVRIEELLVLSTRAKPHLQMAKELVTTFFKRHDGSPPIVQLIDGTLQENIQLAVQEWEAHGDRQSTVGTQDETPRRSALSALRRALMIDLHSRLQSPLTALQGRSDFAELRARLAGEQLEKTGLSHWLHHTEGFEVLRTWMTERRAAESIEFVSNVMKFKRLEDTSHTKDNATRIHARFIADGALAQVCLPGHISTGIQHGLEPRYPSDKLFDEAVDHVLGFLNQEMWTAFKSSSAYTACSPKVLKQLAFQPTDAPLLLAIRHRDCRSRHVIFLSKNVITIGRTHSDVLLREAVATQSTALQFAKGSEADCVVVTLLWNATPNRTSLRSSGARFTMSRWGPSIGLPPQSNRSTVMATNKPHIARFGEAFLVGELECIVLSSRLPTPFAA